jgi:hypothetical protein
VVSTRPGSRAGRSRPARDQPLDRRVGRGDRQLGDRGHQHARRALPRIEVRRGGQHRGVGLGERWRRRGVREIDAPAPRGVGVDVARREQDRAPARRRAQRGEQPGIGLDPRVDDQRPARALGERRLGDRDQHLRALAGRDPLIEAPADLAQRLGGAPRHAGDHVRGRLERRGQVEGGRAPAAAVAARQGHRAVGAHRGQRVGDRHRGGGRRRRRLDPGERRKVVGHAARPWTPSAPRSPAISRST